MANRYTKKRSVPLIKEMQIKATISCHLPPVKMSVTKERKTTGVGGPGEIGTLVHGCWGFT